MQPIELKEKHVSTALFQFIIPFSLKAGTDHDLSLYLEEQDFTPFQLSDVHMEQAFYGSYHVSHRDLEAFFLPLTNKILFPTSEQQKGFQRYTKKLDINSLLTARHVSIPFHIHSVDLFICPYDLGFLTIRSEINNLPLSQTIEFADCLRIMEPQLQKSKIEYGGKVYPLIMDFLFDYLVPQLTNYMNNEAVTFLTRQKMYVQSLLSISGEGHIDSVDVYRIGTLCGLNSAGNPYVRANNLEYISNYINDYSYNRWAPTTSYLIDEQSFSCVTIEKEFELSFLIEQFYGPFYYVLLINLFHKFVLLKITDDFAVMNINQDKKEVDKLIYTINSFTSTYFFAEYPVSTEGQELFNHLRKSFIIDNLYSNTKDILSSLFKYDENNMTKRDSLVLLILTLYTVLCGIFSMNLFTHDLKGNIKWSHFKYYNPLEYFAVGILLSGIIVVAILGFQSLYQAIQDRIKRKKWLEKSVTSSKKQ